MPSIASMHGRQPAVAPVEEVRDRCGAATDTFTEPQIDACELFLQRQQCDDRVQVAAAGDASGLDTRVHQHGVVCGQCHGRVVGQRHRATVPACACSRPTVSALRPDAVMAIIVRSGEGGIVASTDASSATGGDSVTAQTACRDVGGEPRRAHAGQHDRAVAVDRPLRQVVEQCQQRRRLGLEIREEGRRIHGAEPIPANRRAGRAGSAASATYRQWGRWWIE